MDTNKNNITKSEIFNEFKTIIGDKEILTYGNAIKAMDKYSGQINNTSISDSAIQSLVMSERVKYGSNATYSPHEVELISKRCVESFRDFKNENNEFKQPSNEEIYIWELEEQIKTLKETCIALSKRAEYSKEEKEKYWDFECECGLIGYSNILLGGGQIADTGDYGNTYCPCCNNNIN